MKRLADWITRESRRQASVPRLEHALLTDRGGAYVAYRLRYLVARVGVRTAVHMAELLLLSGAVPLDWLMTFIGYRTLTGLLSSLYWGALEPMRDAVRASVQRRHFATARLQIHNWLRISIGLGVFGTLVAGLWVMGGPSGPTTQPIFQLFALACFGRLAFDLWARALHSGIFAVRRVYRPLWSILLPEFVEFLVLLVLFPKVDLIAFPAMVILGGGVRIGLLVTFATRAYGGSRIAAPTVRESLGVRHVVTKSDGIAALTALVSNATAQLDAILIMLLIVVGRGGSDDGPTFVAIYYVMRPLMAVAHGWARAFYFDFKRVEHGIQLFRRRFRRLLTKTSIVLGLLVAGCVLALTVWIAGRLDASLLCLPAFFVARSLYSVRHLEAFSSGEHRALLSVSLGVLGGVAVVAGLVRSEAIVLLAATVCLVVGHRLLWVPERLPRDTRVGLPRWLSRLRAQSGPVQVHAVVVDRELVGGGRLMRRIAAALPEACVTLVGRSHVLWFEQQAQGPTVCAADVARICEGLATNWRSVVVSSGASAFAEVRKAGLLPRDIGVLLDELPATDLVAEYTTACVTGAVINARRGHVKGGVRLGASELRAIMVAIRAAADGATTSNVGDVDVLVYAPGGEPDTIFISPKSARPGPDFRRRVLAASLRASLGDTPLEPVAQRGA